VKTTVWSVRVMKAHSMRRLETYFMVHRRVRLM
jgi:hypothetical protein